MRTGTLYGTLSLFGALAVATGRVTNETRARHTGADFLAFLRLVARTYPRGEVHVILDDVAPTRHPCVQRWLGRHKRLRFDSTPTSASWMNQVETWFGILINKAIRRGSFKSVRELVAMIDAFTRQWNDGSSPFAWVRTADEILAKAVRKPRATSESRHSDPLRSPGSPFDWQGISPEVIAVDERDPGKDGPARSSPNHAPSP